MSIDSYAKIKHRINNVTRSRCPNMEYVTTDGQSFTNINFAHFHQEMIDQREFRAKRISEAVEKELTGTGHLFDIEIFLALTDVLGNRFKRAFISWIVDQLKTSNKTPQAKALIRTAKTAVTRNQDQVCIDFTLIDDLKSFISQLKLVTLDSLNGYEMMSSTTILGDLFIEAINHCHEHPEQPETETRSCA